MKKEISYAKGYYVDTEGNAYSSRGKLKPRPVGYHANGSSYIQVALYVNKVRIDKYVHVLVAEAFIEGYDNSLQVNHIDGDKSNNVLSNLELTTASENMKHAYSEGLVVIPDCRVRNVNKAQKKRLTKSQTESATTIENT